MKDNTSIFAMMLVLLLTHASCCTTNLLCSGPRMGSTDKVGSVVVVSMVNDIDSTIFEEIISDSLNIQK